MLGKEAGAGLGGGGLRSGSPSHVTRRFRVCVCVF